jgi:hypothetical protein
MGQPATINGFCKNQIEMDGIPDTHNRVLIEHAICVFAARRQQP